MSSVARSAARGADFGGAVKRYYFSVAFALLTALSLLAFRDNLIFDVSQPSNSDPKMIVHGLFSLAWVLVLTVQANLVRVGNVRLHRRLGIAGFLAAAGLTLSTAYVFVAVWKGWSAMAPHVQANRILLPSFALCIAFAYLNRRRPDLHKRLVYAGTLLLLEPVLSRCFDPLVAMFLPPVTQAQDDLIFSVYMVGVWSAFFFSLFLYDFIVSRRIHFVSIGAYGWLWAVNAFVYLT